MLKKIMILGISLLFVNGCMSAEMKIKLNKDDSGSVKLTIAYAEDYIEEGTFTDFDEPKEGVTVKNITYVKDETTYIGRELSYSFKDLEDFNAKFTNNVADEEDNQNISITREKNIVTVTMPGDEASYNEYGAMVDAIEYTINITIDGKVVENNATSFNKKTNTLTWELEDTLKNGILLEYDTSTDITIFIPLIIAFIATVGIYIVTKKQGKSEIE